MVRGMSQSRQASSRPSSPGAILFPGGDLKAPAVQNRSPPVQQGRCSRSRSLGANKDAASPHTVHLHWCNPTCPPKHKRRLLPPTAAPNLASPSGVRPPRPAVARGRRWPGAIRRRATRLGICILRRSSVGLLFTRLAPATARFGSQLPAYNLVLRTASSANGQQGLTEQVLRLAYCSEMATIVHHRPCNPGALATAAKD
jgi:hypothetical protein